MVLTSAESDQYSSASKEKSKLPLMYKTGYFYRPVYLADIVLTYNTQKECKNERHKNANFVVKISVFSPMSGTSANCSVMAKGYVSDELFFL